MGYKLAKKGNGIFVVVGLVALAIFVIVGIYFSFAGDSSTYRSPIVGRAVGGAGCVIVPWCPADLNCDNKVNAFDLARLLGAWGKKPGTNHPADLNHDGVVNGADINLLIDDWGVCPPAPVCGNGEVEYEEQCDDGNTDQTDQCNDHCDLTYCGDGIVQSPNGQNLNEQCELPGTETCSDNCLFVVPGTQYSLSVTKSGTGLGTVTSSPEGIDCGLDCSENYNSGTVVTLSASASSGSTFTGWSD